MTRHIPNALSGARLVLAVAMLALIGSPVIVFWMYVLAMGTDLADGHLARWLRSESTQGARLDDGADKLLTVSVVLCVVISHWLTLWALLGIMALSLICWLAVRSNAWDHRRVRLAVYVALAALYEIFVSGLLSLAYGWHYYYPAVLATATVLMALLYRDRIISYLRPQEVKLGSQGRLSF